MDNLISKAKLAVYWNTGFNLFRDLLQFVVMLVLVRIIPPEAYGQFGLVNSIIGFISIFSFTSFISHSLQIRKIEDIDYQTHFTAGFFIQLFAVVVSIMTGVVLSYFNNYKEISWLVAIMAITFILELPAEFQRKQFEKILDWKRLRILHGIGLVASSMLAIIMALAGAGVYALLIPGLTTSLPFIYELFVKSKWRPTWTFDKIKYKETLKFALAQSGTSLTAKVQPLIESTIFTSVIGFYGFGIYGRAFGFARMVSEKFVSQLLYATYPVLTNIDTKSEQFKRAVSTLLIIIMSFIIPVSIIFSLNAESIVLLLYGNKWIAVIPLLPFTIFIVSFSALNNTFYNILLSYYKQNLLFIISIISLIINIFLLIIILNKGITNYLTGLFFLQFILLIVYIIIASFYKLIELKFILRKLLGLLIMAIISNLPMFLISKYLENNQNIVKLVGIVIYFILYLIFLRLFMTETFLTIINYLPFKEKTLAIFRIKQ
ncbi:MAG TPA: oligosaccharide flippase family protein [Ignavibacteriaceae bacterium]|nr:oligosaccharide flippase family protein [Ignavibacteriaceae bacterium]